MRRAPGYAGRVSDVTPDPRPDNAPKPTLPAGSAGEAAPARRGASAVDDAATERADQHGALVATQVGAACAFGATVLAAMTVWWLGSFAYRVGLVTPMSWLGLGACVVELALIVTLLLLWRRVLRAHIGAGQALPGQGLSDGLHWLSYLVTLLGLVGLIWAMAGIATDQLGFWTLGGAALLLLVAHSAGGVQRLRHDGPPGTLRAHIQHAIARSNAKADAQLDAQE